MYHHIKMMELYILSITINTEVIAVLQGPGDEEMLTTALDNRDNMWRHLYRHFQVLGEAKHPLCAHYIRVVDALIEA